VSLDGWWLRMNQLNPSCDCSQVNGVVPEQILDCKITVLWLNMMKELVAQKNSFHLNEIFQNSEIHDLNILRWWPTAVFWDITLSSPLNVICYIRGIGCFHLRGTRAEVCLLPASCRYLVWLILLPWRWRQQVPLKCWLTFSGLHDT
jgi:hypothetical protein